MPPRPTTIDEYLAALTDERRAPLEKVRKSIQSAVPKAVECIVYGLPAFRLDGRPLMLFGAAKRHCSLYPWSSSVITAHQDDLDGYDTSKGTIRFAVDKAPPAALIRKLVKTRIAEISARNAKNSKAARKSAKPTKPTKKTKKKKKSRKTK